MDRQREVQPHELGVLQRAEDGQPHPEPVLHHLVDGVRVGDAPLDDGDGLPPQGVLEPVAHEPRHVALHPHRVLAQVREQGHRGLYRGRGRPIPGDHLHQGDQGRRVPEVGADDPPRPLGLAGDLGDADDRGVGREDRLLRAQGVEAPEHVLLQFQVLGHGLHHELGAARPLGEVGGGADPRQGRLDLLLPGEAVCRHPREAVADPAPNPRQHPGVGVGHGDVVASVGEQLGDAVPHQAGAHDQHLPRCRLPPTPGAPTRRHCRRPRRGCGP